MLARRNLVGELMDDPALAPEVHRGALRGLRRINWLSRTAAILWRRIEPVLVAQAKDGASLLDVACGGGELAIALARCARRRGLALAVQGCDVSETALQHASLAAGLADERVEFFKADVNSGSLPRHYTFTTCTLFLHHLTDARIVALLRLLRAQSDHLLVGDLIRGRSGYALAWMGTRLVSRSPIVHEDGMRSVRAALTLPEARRLANEAGLEGARFDRIWPRRFLLTWPHAR